MNLANKITIFRVILIPVFLIILLSGLLLDPINRYVATFIFIIASATDALDGYIARKKNMITNFGKFADPLADKLLVASALISLVELNDLSAWVVILIISREFMVTGLRLIAVSKKIVISASFWGKIKTVTQMLMIVYVLLALKGVAFEAVKSLIIGLAVIFTVISGLDYFIKNLEVLKEETGKSK